MAPVDEQEWPRRRLPGADSAVHGFPSDRAGTCPALTGLVESADDPPPPWHDVPIYGGRDLARDDLWAISAAVAVKKREVARQPPQLPKARRAGVSLVVAAIAAATPALSFAHTKPKGKDSRQGRVVVRGLLEMGDRGPGVVRLQRALGITADGVFGPQTLEAVRSFQAGAGLTVDGIVGPLTRAALGLDGQAGGKLLELGDRGSGVRLVQQALGVPADGVFGPQTLSAVRSFQARAGLTVDGIVGPQTRAALGDTDPAPRADGGHTHGSGGGQAPAGSMPDVDRRLAGAVGLAREMGMKVISGYREGATIAASGNRSDHSFYPSRAIDVSGTATQMRRYALRVAGMKNIDTVIYAGVGLWSGGGWHEIQSSVTYRDHVDHVHVDTF